MIRKSRYFFDFHNGSSASDILRTKEDAGSLAVDENISASLTYDHRMQLDYAKEFAVDYYNDGLALITISDGSRFWLCRKRKRRRMISIPISWC